MVRRVGGPVEWCTGSVVQRLSFSVQRSKISSLDHPRSHFYIRLMQLHEAVKTQFARVMGSGAGGRQHVVRAPGRVNLIGEHTDYNEGFICPMAIEPQVLIACRAREDGIVRLASTAFPGEVVEFSIEKKIERGRPQW